MAAILVVDDDSEVLGTTWRALTRDGHDVHLAESAAVSPTRRMGRTGSSVSDVLTVTLPLLYGLAPCGSDHPFS